MPELFSNYIIVSPSLWYDGRLMFRREDEFAQNHKDLPARIYFGAGSREVNMAEDLRSFTAQMQKRNYQGLDMQWRIFDDETHNSVFPFALSCGLRMMYGIGSWMEQN